MIYRAGTVVSRNYLNLAGMVARSFSAHHPGIEFVTLVLDGMEKDKERDDVGRVLLVSDLDLDVELFGRMSTMYSAIDMVCAFKPVLLRHLLQEGSEAALWVDSDFWFYSDVNKVFSDAAEEGILLTPIALTPYPRDGRKLSETDILLAGMYSAGLLAVGKSAVPFLDWWFERLQTDSQDDRPNGLFGDQRWLDWVSVLFPHRSSPDLGLNVGYWNLHERPISLRDGVYFAGEDRLRCMHFSGYDPLQPERLTIHVEGNVRIELMDHPDLRRLADGYGARVIASGHLGTKTQPYGFAALPNGLELSPEIRSAYRLAEIGTIPTTIPAPHPIDCPDEFTAWLADPASVSPTSPLSVFERGLWFSRSDLKVAFPFPFVDGGDGDDYRKWLDADPFVQEQLRILRARPTVDGYGSVGPDAVRAAARSRMPDALLAAARSDLSEAIRQLASTREEFAEASAEAARLRAELDQAYVDLDRLTKERNAAAKEAADSQASSRSSASELLRIRGSRQYRFARRFGLK